MLRKISLVFLLLSSPAAAKIPAVVTDLPAVHSLVSQVMQGVGTPQILLDQGSDPHSFQLRPSQARAISQADLLFWIGPELTPWLQRAISGIGLKGKQLELFEAQGTILRSFEDSDEHKTHEHGEHDHSGLDPHVWLDPKNALIWLDLIASELGKSDPENAATYLTNASSAKIEITALIAETELALAPVENRPIVVFHDAYGYFADRFNLKIAGVIRDGDAVAPGAAHLTELQAKIGHLNIACAFSEATHDPALIHSMFKDTGIAIGTLDPSGSSLTYGPNLYADLIRNLTNELMICAKN